MGDIVKGALNSILDGSDMDTSVTAQLNTALVNFMLTEESMDSQLGLTKKERNKLLTHERGREILKAILHIKDKHSHLSDYGAAKLLFSLLYGLKTDPDIELSLIHQYDKLLDRRVSSPKALSEAIINIKYYLSPSLQ